MTRHQHNINLDIALIGGGIAGLWLANRLARQGYDFALFEHKALGSDQTLASQGMIHGGMKYTLGGALTGASESIADMPNHWRACLCGEGDVDLRRTRILSDHFYLWSNNSVSAKLASFLASKVTRGRVDTVKDTQRPPFLRNRHFTGNLYRLADMVVDTQSLVTNLAHNIEPHCFLIDWAEATLTRAPQGAVSLRILRNEQDIHINAKQFIFTAGKGNATLLQQLGLESPAMQLRPLQQVMVKHAHPYSFFGHCLGIETTPRLTISSHKLNQFEQVWYLGGSLAERGASMSADELIEAAKQDLAELVPWVDLSEAEWATLPIDRAEPQQPNFIRPDHAFIAPAKGCDNLLVGWPTKLTLAPNLASQALDLLAQAGCNPTPSPQQHLLAQWLPKPSIAQMPWEIAFPPALSAEEALTLKLQDALIDAYDEELDGTFSIEKSSESDD